MLITMFEPKKVLKKRLVSFKHKMVRKSIKTLKVHEKEQIMIRKQSLH